MSVGINRLLELERSIEQGPRRTRKRFSVPKRQRVRRDAVASSFRIPDIVAFATPVSCDVGFVPELKQPTSYSCWATVTTMLVSWRDKQSRSIKDVMASIGDEWLELFNASKKKGLPFNKHEQFLAAAGLVAETPQSFTVEGWENLLRIYGPLWVSSDEQLGYGTRFHARLVVGIHGDGTPEGTDLTIIDPGSGKRFKEKFSHFVKKYEELVHETGLTPPQIIHFHSDAHKQTETSQSQAVATVATVVGVGYTIASEALQNKGDITWKLQTMKGAKHPWDKKKLYDKGPWTTKTFDADCWSENPIGDRISAKFEVRFRYNGNSVGYITIQNTGTNDAVGWGLDVNTTIMPDPQAYKIKGKQPIAAVELTFNYRFTRSIGADKIYVQRLTLKGNGDVGEYSRWTQ